MDTAQLKTFIAVVEQQSITLAAQQLYISQPAASKRLSTLEEELQCKLFHRNNKKLVLTEPGALFLQKSYKILHEIENTKRELLNLQQSVSGNLNIATSHHIGIHHLPVLLKEYKNHYPQVNLRLFFLESEKAMQQLKNGKYDCALITLPASIHPDFRYQNIWQDPLFLCYSDHHPLNRQKNVSLQELTKYPAILPPAHSYTRELIEHFFYKKNIKLRDVMESAYLETIKMMVEAGLGWSFLPKTLIQPNWKIVSTRSRFYRNLGIIAPKNMVSSKAAEHFWQLCTH